MTRTIVIAVLVLAACTRAASSQSFPRANPIQPEVMPGRIAGLTYAGYNQLIKADTLGGDFRMFVFRVESYFGDSAVVYGAYTRERYGPSLPTLAMHFENRGHPLGWTILSRDTITESEGTQLREEWYIEDVLRIWLDTEEGWFHESGTIEIGDIHFVTPDSVTIPIALMPTPVRGDNGRVVPPDSLQTSPLGTRLIALRKETNFGIYRWLVAGSISESRP